MPAADLYMADAATVLAELESVTENAEAEFVPDDSPITDDEADTNEPQGIRDLRDRSDLIDFEVGELNDFWVPTGLTLDAPRDGNDDDPIRQVLQGPIHYEDDPTGLEGRPYLWEFDPYLSDPEEEDSSVDDVESVRDYGMSEDGISEADLHYRSEDEWSVDGNVSDGQSEGEVTVCTDGTEYAPQSDDETTGGDGRSTKSTDREEGSNSASDKHDNRHANGDNTDSDSAGNTDATKETEAIHGADTTGAGTNSATDASNSETTSGTEDKPDDTPKPSLTDEERRDAWFKERCKSTIEWGREMGTWAFEQRDIPYTYARAVKMSARDMAEALDEVIKTITAVHFGLPSAESDQDCFKLLLYHANAAGNCGEYISPLGTGGRPTMWAGTYEAYHRAGWLFDPELKDDELQLQCLFGIGPELTVPCLFWSHPREFITAAEALATFMYLQQPEDARQKIYEATDRLRIDIVDRGGFPGFLPMGFGIPDYLPVLVEFAPDVELLKTNDAFYLRDYFNDRVFSNRHVYRDDQIISRGKHFVSRVYGNMD